MRRAGAWLAVVFAAAAALQGWRAVSLTAGAMAFHDGVRAYDRGAYADALDRFLSARERNPTQPTLSAWIGDAARSAHDFPRRALTVDRSAALLTRAWEAYGQAVLRNPLDSWSWAGLAEVANRRAAALDAGAPIDLARIEDRAQGRLEPWRAAAVGAARIAVSLKPSGYQELDVLAETYAANGDAARARDVYVKSASMLPAPSYHAWGYAGKLAPPLYRAIVEGLNHGLAATPDYFRPLLAIECARFAAVQGDPASSLAFADRARAGATSDYERYHADSEASRALGALGRREEAITRLEGARHFGFDGTDISRRLGALYFEQGRHDDACAELQMALRGIGGSELRMLTSRACESAGDTETAELLLEDGISDPSADPTLARALLDLKLRTGRPQAALALAQAWAEEFPRPPFDGWARELRAARGSAR